MISTVLRQIGIALVIVILGAVVGALLGYATAPRYTPPGSSGEERLRDRAEQFYHAMQVMDFATMGKLYTPARQLADHAELTEKAKDRAALFLRIKPETRSEMLAAVATIHADELAVVVEGDWAVTGGNRTMYKDDDEIDVPLINVAWIRANGDWWVYQYKTCELAAYGAPPDVARQLFLTDEDQGLIDTGTNPNSGGPGGENG